MYQTIKTQYQILLELQTSVADTVGKVGSTAIDIVRKAKELRSKPAITDEAVNKVLNASEVKGSGFFYVRRTKFWIIQF